MNTPEHSPLGKSAAYRDHYAPELLCPLPRQTKRDEIAMPTPLPFSGYDLWNGYEISWLNRRGKPEVALGQFVFPCTSPNLIESKSFKLYLNSLNNSSFRDRQEVSKCLAQDLSVAAGAPVKVTLRHCSDYPREILTPPGGIALDLQDIDCTTYQVDPSLLSCRERHCCTERVYSNLLKSNCLVTGQPDWGTLCITYTGKPIDHAGLLRYIVSFRNHNEFHEQCVERIFQDLSRCCEPEQLTVSANYTRRGGLDINPYRTTSTLAQPDYRRLVRQ